MSIQEHLNKIRNAIKGSEVRESIAKGIETAYDDASENGNANMEVKIARGTHPNLRSRLEEVDSKQQQTTAQLAHKADKGNVSVHDINKSLGKLDETYMSDTLLQQMAGTTPINATVSNLGLTDVKHDFNSISSDKLNFINESSNIFNKADIVYDKSINSSGDITDFSGRAYSHIIRVRPGETLTMTGVLFYISYDENSNFIGRTDLPDITNNTVQVGDNVYSIRIGFTYAGATYNIDNIQLNRGGTLLPYEPYWLKMENIMAEAKPSGIKNGHYNNNSISPEKTSFIETSTNLFNGRDSVHGFHITSGGEIIPHAVNSISPHISVNPGMSYASAGLYFVAFYDVNEKFVSRLEITNRETEILNIPQNVYTMRAIWRPSNNTWNVDTIQINKGSTLLPYEPYWLKIAGLADTDVNEITPRDTTFIHESTNLIDYKNFIWDKRINPSGVIVDFERFGITNFFYVEPHMKLTGRGIMEVAYYDVEGNFISREQASNYEEHTFTVPNNARQGRANFSTNSLLADGNLLQLNIGDVLLPNEKLKSTFTFESGLSKLNEIITDDFMERDDAFMVDMDVNGVYQAPQDFGDWRVVRTLMHTEIYALFDELMTEFPDYITREVIGNDPLGNNINMYRFKPEMTEIRHGTVESKHIKLLLNCGTHGSEKATTIAAYHMFKEMSENWKSDPLLEVLRFNVEFLFIPVFNPSGWDIGTRQNSNGVDLNRNFPEIWRLSEEDSYTYGGPYPASEPETQALIDVFENNRDISIMCEFHNFGPETLVEGQNTFIFLNSEDDNHFAQMGRNLISRVSRMWSKEYEWFTEGDLTGYVDMKYGATGRIASYANSFDNIKFAGALEICNRWNVKPDGTGYDEAVIKAGMETITNWVLINIRELIK